MQTKEQIEDPLRGMCCPIGWLYTLVSVSVTKRMLASKIPTEYRLAFLEHLDGMTKGDDRWLTADMIAAVEPMCGKGYEMIREANKLGPKALDAYAKFFPTFALLNPSLIEALKISPANVARAEYQARLGVPA